MSSSRTPNAASSRVSAALSRAGSIARDVVRSVPWLRLGVASAACVGFGVGMFFALRPDLWMVSRVAFTGTHRASAAELRHLLDLPNGTTMWSVDPREIQAAVSRHPWVLSAEVSIRWPETVVVDIAERRAVALLHDGDRLLFVDQEGTPFLPAQGDELDLPHLTGMGSALAELHPALPRRAIRDALWLLGALEREGLVPAEHISEVSFSRTSGFVVVAPPARLAFGLSDLPAEVDRLSRLVSEGVSLDEPRLVDLAPATVAIVRPLSGPPRPPVPPSGG